MRNYTSLVFHFKHLCSTMLLLSAAANFLLPSTVFAADRSNSPNLVIIFTDDQGYADVGCYGAKDFQTPNLDRMAAEGMRFTDFYVAQAVCGASRAALLTGCYPNRIGMLGAPSHNSKHGIHENELLIPELLKQKKYVTGMFGKWHLGHHQKFLPVHHGFDEYYGLPYSNDMWPNHPTAGKHYPPLPMIEGDKVVNPNVTPEDQNHLTIWYTQRAVKFIEKNKDQPFFLYLAHSMPHVPLGVSDKYKGKSKQGMYGDVIMEIDWSVGRILATLKKHNLDENTLVIFTSDNGPWLSYGNHAGSAGPLREGKGTAWEGGVREPCIMRWPGKIKAGSVCHELAATIDILPTIAHLTGTELSKNKIDGKNIGPLLSSEPNAKTPHEVYYYYYGKGLYAVRSGKWKLHFPHPYRSLTGKPGKDGKPSGYTRARCGLELYDLESDIGETTDVSAKHPEIIKKLQAYGEAAREELGDAFKGLQGNSLRIHGSLK